MMGTTTFTGPVRAGDILNTSGTTLGQDVANVGYVVMAQSADIVQSTTAGTTGIVIPANSTILSIVVQVGVAWSSGTTTYTIQVGTSSSANELVAATNANAVGVLSLSPGTDATRLGKWQDVGATDVAIWIDSGAPDTTPGAGKLIVTYIQANNA
jgi:hypothetical protein